MRHVLLIDDDAEDRLIFGNALAGEATCTLCEDAEAGIEKLMRGPLPHLLFIDIHMPCINGFECLAMIRADRRCTYLPIVMYSGSPLATYVLKSERLGADYYFSKPPGYEVLRQGLLLLLNREPFDAFLIRQTSILTAFDRARH